MILSTPLEIFLQYSLASAKLTEVIIIMGAYIGADGRSRFIERPISNGVNPVRDNYSFS